MKHRRLLPSFWTLTNEERQTYLESELQTILTQVIESTDFSIGLEDSLLRMGVDSLQGVEIKNRIESEYRIALEDVEILELSVRKIGALMLEQLQHDEPELAGLEKGVHTASPDVDDPSRQDRLMEQLDQLSEAELDAMLAQLLKSR
ncbi:MAG: acyl carrier protein [Tumebacillaceae bacterium]